MVNVRELCYIIKETDRYITLNSKCFNHCQICGIQLVSTDLLQSVNILSYEQEGNLNISSQPLQILSFMILAAGLFFIMTKGASVCHRVAPCQSLPTAYQDKVLTARSPRTRPTVTWLYAHLTTGA